MTEAGARLAALPAPANGQVRAVPDERTVRYYAAIGLLDRPSAMRGRTALYGARHLAQLVAIKRMQAAGKSLTEIQAVWSSLDDVTLARMSGVSLEANKPSRAARKEFWKREPRVSPPEPVRRPAAMSPTVAAKPVELRVEIAPGATLSIAVPDGVSISSADVRALRAAAAPLVTELAKCGLTAHVLGTLEEEP